MLVKGATCLSGVKELKYSKFGFNVQGHNIGHIEQLSPNQVD